MPKGIRFWSRPVTRLDIGNDIFSFAGWCTGYVCAPVTEGGGGRGQRVDLWVCGGQAGAVGGPFCPYDSLFSSFIRLLVVLCKEREWLNMEFNEIYWTI
ncbi:hypothetical protein GWI33_008553 [Rhynchophorus ferrugineus]|uniref:Uncharacterized protein n=1 Tax=Rhynchophorus ferrugineus TaxID=354439 RepID=A0A834MC60_RHYFE|nr:hypothetical protein GWI33_008553 [Rhynchophorus ferrugineus]